VDAVLSKRQTMMVLVQFPWSPFCLVQRRILEYSGARFKIVNIPCTDRTLVWRLTRQRYYQVPILKHGRNVIFETDHESQVIAKYVDNTLGLDLFPRALAGVQNILWRHIENEIEEVCFKLNDIYFREFVPAREHLDFIRFKERKFGRGCLEQWRRQQVTLLEELQRRLLPFEQMLTTRPFLLEERPRFVDFDLYGMLANYLYSGHYQLPAPHNRLAEWYQRMDTCRRSEFSL
jgi:glutathione S-transferase